MAKGCQFQNFKIVLLEGITTEIVDTDPRGLLVIVAYNEIEARANIKIQSSTPPERCPVPK